MISNAQKSLIKRAQREAGLSDEDYRDALETACGCRSSTDPRMTDRAVDVVLAYLEALFFRAVDAGKVQPSSKPGAVFQKRGFWASRNREGNTTRDRWLKARTVDTVAQLESALAELGCGPQYCSAIRARVSKGKFGAQAQFFYQRALARTLKAKRAKQATAPQPTTYGNHHTPSL